MISLKRFFDGNDNNAPATLLKLILKPLLSVLLFSIFFSSAAQSAQVTFSVDMSDVNRNGEIPRLVGTFNEWCADCGWMSDANGDDIWSLSLNLSPGNYDYKFLNGNNWGLAENPPSACATTGEWVNRQVVVSTSDLVIPTPPFNGCASVEGNLNITVTVPSSATSVRMTGPWWGWNPNGGPEASNNGDNTWTVTLDNVPSADMEYLWVVNGAQEILYDNAANGECSHLIDSGNLITDYYGWANRKWLLGNGHTSSDTYNSCTSVTGNTGGNTGGNTSNPSCQDTVTGVPVDSDRWFHQTVLPNGWGWHNNEQQHYTDCLDNSYVSDGTLKIVAKKQSFTDQGHNKQYTSARLNSKFAFQYGRVEFRAKMPLGYGTWPAVWMLGKNITENGGYFSNLGYGTTPWPAVGEIDILEHWGRDQGYAQSAMHTSSSYGDTVNHGGRYISTISQQFHNYSMDWDQNKIIFYVDGIEHYRYNPGTNDPYYWPYDKEMYLILNVAIEESISQSFTQSAMEIDYLRVYDTAGNLIFSDEFSADSDGDTYADDIDAFPNDPTEWLDTDGDGVGDNTDDSFDHPLVGNWKIEPISGALGVGEVRSDGSWWSNEAADITTRDCLFDDIYQFTADGKFYNVLGSQTWLEDWQSGQFEACGTPIAPHDGEANHYTYTLDPINNSITLNGKGAYLGIPKAINGNELSSPSNAPNSVTYLIESISPENLVVDIQIDNAWWRFNFIKEVDVDQDNDGVADELDAFPLDPNESVDTDNDGVGNNADTDDDGDGVADSQDAFPLDNSESLDTDNNGIGNNADTDDDADGVADSVDAFPLDNTESVDTDNDGIGNNADTDDDGDGVTDNVDAFALDNSESVDTDNDGIGNNADTDDDGDGILDENDSNPLNPTIKNQIVSVSNSPKAVVGGQVSLDISYDVSTDDNALTGLGLRIHYDSNVLEFVNVNNLLTTDNLINSDASEADNDDFDGNPVTDRFVLFAWASLYGTWPGAELPTSLLTVNFKVKESIDADAVQYTPIGFSSNSNASGYNFVADTNQLNIIAANWDFDANGHADALTDGLLLLRHTFGLTGETLTNGAVALTSPMTNSEIETAVSQGYVIADIDANNQVDALTDGLLLLRYLFGLRDESLVGGAVSIDAQRSQSSDIEQYIINYMPVE